MAMFRDRKGRAWTVDVTVGTIKRVRAIGVDLLSLLDEKAAGLWSLLDDPVQLVDTLYLICQPQAVAANVTDEEFGESLAGASLKDASEAFLEAYADFFADQEKGRLLRAMVAKAKAAGAELTARGQTAIDSLSVESLVERLTESSGSVPASSELTPPPSRLAS